MKALVFGDVPRPDAAAAARRRAPPAAPPGVTPMALREVDDPTLRGPDWAVLRTRLTGICGSDTKQVLMDFEGADDTPMTAFISFPQVLGHEVVATVEDAGPEAGRRGRPAGGAQPVAVVRAAGHRPAVPGVRRPATSACAGTSTTATLAPGIHTGNSSDATGGFAELLPAHRRMLRPGARRRARRGRGAGRPVRGVAPRHHPQPAAAGRPGRRLRRRRARHLRHRRSCAALHPDVEVATVARCGRPRRRWPAELGATTFAPEPRLDADRGAGDWSGGVLRQPWDGLPSPGPAASTSSTTPSARPRPSRSACGSWRSRGTLVQLGRRSPARFEWTPWYFKELRLVGSNAFGIEEVDGVAQARHRPLPRPRARRPHRPRPACSPTPSPWRTGATPSRRSIDQGDTGAIKVAFDLRSASVSERYTLISADSHAGGSHAQYREYLDPAYRDDFDAWREQVPQPVQGPEAQRPAGAQLGRRGALGRSRRPTASSPRSCSPTRCRRSSPASCSSRGRPSPTSTSTASPASGPTTAGSSTCGRGAPTAGPASARSSSTTSTTPSPTPAGSRSTACGAACSSQRRRPTSTG